MSTNVLDLKTMFVAGHLFNFLVIAHLFPALLRSKADRLKWQFEMAVSTVTSRVTMYFIN